MHEVMLWIHLANLLKGSGRSNGRPANTDRWACILAMRYGPHRSTQAEVATALGCSQGNISRCELSAIRALSHPNRRDRALATIASRELRARIV